MTKYGIIANPNAGTKSIDEKAAVLRDTSRVLGSDSIVMGLDTQSRTEFEKAASDLAKRVDTLVIAGGDGTFTNTINALGLEPTYAYLPLGTYNGIGREFGYQTSLAKVAQQIKDASVRNVDMVDCMGRKSFVASVGFDAEVVKNREACLRNGARGISGYLRAIGKTMATFKPRELKYSVDNGEFNSTRCINAMVGSGRLGYIFKANPKTRLKDGKLNAVILNSIIDYISPFPTYFQADQLSLVGDFSLQTDGELAETATKRVDFRVLPECLKVKY